MTFPILAFLFILLRLTSAIPFHQLARTLPRDITHIAHDEEHGVYHAYRSDDSLYGTYPAGNYSTSVKRDDSPACPVMSLEELKLHRFWSKVEAYADDKWGKGKREVEINSPKSPGYSVRTCVDTEPVPVEMGDERCADSRLKINGTLLGTNGTLRLVFAQGYTNTAKWSVTKAINVGVSTQFSVTFKIPEIASLGTDVTVKTKVKNEKASAYETTTANTVTQEVWMAAIAGKKCGGYVTSKSCNVDAKARVRFVVEGWVWFVYKKKKKGRTRWAVPLDSALTLEERSDWLETRGNMKASVTTDYVGLCE